MRAEDPFPESIEGQGEAGMTLGKKVAEVLVLILALLAIVLFEVGRSG